ncbi:MAG: DUF2817 domain-containing protein [Rhodoferax sp.]|uniref:DUF2817 domain-containing protein n=1 Tax=Rhodoferax sp. TaxID=50421 RepID=UPI00262585C4|nr:DUF2817 domain-containing protein [Rhodoferax sp.]MDD5336273.1 DUF2817 domain-containing protein [Rhodoferax sp.]
MEKIRVSMQALLSTPIRFSAANVVGAPNIYRRNQVWGKSGACERIFAGKSGDAAALARAREWWGGKGATPVKIVDDGTSVSAPATGLIWHIIYEECPQAEITPLCLECGTQPTMQVLKALRAEQWLTLHPDAPVAQAAGIKRGLRDAFYVDTAAWKEKIVDQARQAMLQALSL